MRDAKITAVGLLGGDAVAWRRWWLSRDGEPTLSEGMLLNPEGEYSRFLNRGLVQLAERADARARVLLADGGMGKSVELRCEVDRLRLAGEFTQFIDLGAYASTGEVKDAIAEAVRSWQEAGTSGDLILAFDGFDELLVDVVNLRDLLVSELSRLDLQRLRIVVASRPSVWSSALSEAFVEWWGNEDVASLHLAPLTAADVAVAARSEKLDGDEFVGAVRAASVGPLAARPITLRLLLSGAHQGSLPSCRLDAYRIGVADLASEPNARRKERRRGGAVLHERLAAARRLATLTLLTGRHSIVRRLEAGQKLTQLALDEAADDSAELAALDDVWDSALLAGDGAVRRWCHHSVAEFLCAEALACLPVETAWSLLAAPGAPKRLRPQLEEIAGWVASINDAMFERLADSQPWLLTNSDLTSRASYERERVGRAVVERLTNGKPVFDRLERVTARALAYTGIESDLEILICAGRPQWQRREAVALIATLGLRSVDRTLLGIVEDARGRAVYDDVVRLAVYAACALDGAVNPDIIGRMCVLLGDTAVSSHVRGALTFGLFPSQLDVKGLARRIQPHERFAGVLGGAVHQAIYEAVSRGQVSADELIPWFAGLSDIACHDHQTRKLASAAALAGAAAGCTGPSWLTAVGIVAWLLRNPNRPGEWSVEDVDSLEPHLRRKLSCAVLGSHDDGVLANALADQRLLRVDDLLWWLDKLVEEQGGAEASAVAAIRVLSWLVLDDDKALTAARVRCAASSALTAFAENEFSEQIVAHRRARANEQDRQRQAQRVESQFSPHRLAVRLAAGDFPAAIGELRKQPARDKRLAGSVGPLRAWASADVEARREVVRLGIAHLTSHEPELDDFEDVCNLGETISVISAGDEQTLDIVPAARWGQWLRALVTSSNIHAAQVCLRRVLAHDLAGATATLQELIDAGDRGAVHLSPELLDILPAPTLEDLADHALTHADRQSVPVGGLSGLFTIGNRGKPSVSAQVAVSHIRRTPRSPTGDPGDLDTLGRLAWLRAVTATDALIRNPASADFFDDLLAAFEEQPRLAIEALRSWGSRRPQNSWSGLRPEQIARLYLWAKSAMPSRTAEPGVIMSSDRAEELPGDLLTVLTRRGDGASVRALRDLAITTNNVHLQAEAERLESTIASEVTAPPSPRAVRAVLDNPGRRAITSTSQLAQVVLNELDNIAIDIQRDRGLRHRLWEHQRDGTKWTSRYVPVEELRLAEQLASELTRRLRGRVAIVREVQIQPRLSQTGADIPDILAVGIATDTAKLQLPLEVKGNYHEQVVVELGSKLAERYLAGPVGNEGIYVVGYFHGECWDFADKNRRRAAGRYSIGQLRALLEAEAGVAAKNGTSVHVRVLDIPLDLPSPLGDR